MRRQISLLLVTALLLTQRAYVVVMADEPNASSSTPPLAITGEEEHILLEPGLLQPNGIELSTPLSVIDDSPLHAGVTQQALAAQDQKNLELMWLAVLKNNPTIQFALRQLNTPDSIRRHHKSVMARALSGLLSGVGMLPYAFGSTASTVSAAAVTQNVGSHIASKADKIDPNSLPSDAELVMLSSTVEAVRKDLVSNYFQYKQSLQAMVDLDEQWRTVYRYKSATEKTALWQADLLALMQYQSIERDRVEARQKAATSYMRLERMVGPETMQTVSFQNAEASELPSEGQMESVELTPSVSQETSPEESP